MVHSILIIGQSNMAGRGIIAGAEPLDTRGVILTRKTRWTMRCEATWSCFECRICYVIPTYKETKK